LVPGILGGFKKPGTKKQGAYPSPLAHFFPENFQLTNFGTFTTEGALVDEWEQAIRKGKAPAWFGLGRQFFFLAIALLTDAGFNPEQMR
jgi:hypothetical protein